jgi:hypothetical protein
MAGTLLVTSQYMADSAVEEGVVGGEDGTSGHTEYHFYAFVLEALEK